VRLASEGKFLNRGIKGVVRSICCGNVGKMSTNPDEPKSRARTDFLLNNELEVQKFWDENTVFQADPGNDSPSPGEKFFGNFPYPYMNGLLHMGHAFSLSKLEFGAAYHMAPLFFCPLLSTALECPSRPPLIS